jgi:hypothetical protein
MSRGVRISKHHAVFAPGFKTPSYFRLIFFLSTRSRRLRAFAYGLPRSRFRTFLVARYYHWLVEQFRVGNFSFLPTLSEDGRFELFDLHAYVGRNGVREGLTEWREMFSSPIFELIELVNPPGSDVFGVVRTGGEGFASGVRVEDLSYVVIRIENGVATAGRTFREKARALEAAGLSAM